MKKLILAITAFFILSAPAFAFSGDMSINSNDITFSSNNLLEGKMVRIYASATNNSDKDLLGVVRFYDNSNQISSDQAISIFARKTDGVFIDWLPSYGSHRVAVKIFPWNAEIDDPSNNWIVTEVFVTQDTDRDSIPNSEDPDDDNDLTPDNEDIAPLNPNEQYDTDGDNIGNNADPDDDNDDVPDEYDDLPLDPNETIDTDKDGIGNIADTDDDNDGIKDNDEENSGTSPLKIDTDEDNSSDNVDAFPLDPEEQIDTDKDKIGNNTDIDDDNDEISDKDDPFPLNKGPVIKLTDKQTSLDVMKEHTFDASPSYDEDGKIVSYLWEIDDTIQEEGNSITHTFKKRGPHKVKLTVTDNAGESKTSEFQISIMNLGFYKIIVISIMTILLALIIYFKYIAEAKNLRRPKTTKSK